MHMCMKEKVRVKSTYHLWLHQLAGHNPRAWSHSLHTWPGCLWHSGCWACRRSHRASPSEQSLDKQARTWPTAPSPSHWDRTKVTWPWWYLFHSACSRCCCCSCQSSPRLWKGPRRHCRPPELAMRADVCDQAGYRPEMGDCYFKENPIANYIKFAIFLCRSNWHYQFQF